MIRKDIPLVFFFLLFAEVLSSQPLIRTSALFQRESTNRHSGQLAINQELALDTLISRHILANKNLFRVNNHYGMDGYRIQIYASSNRNAREESNKVNADFISKFPEIVSYQLFAEPGYYKTRVGDFRTKIEATKLFLIISREFPDAYMVPDVINFPDLNIK